MNLKPWREVAVPHSDVLKGTFQQSEFAADISAVAAGKALPIYQDAAAFFERTYITEGMRLLLTQVAQRLCGLGGEPVIQLQTAFGGGKTHTMLAVYHLATRAVPLSDLPGIPTLIERVGLMDVPRSKVAVIDGTALAPGQPWKHGRASVNTLWGELAWQLGGSEGLAMVREADTSGTSPGKDALRELLAASSPCVILMDEVARYIGQFEEGKSYTGGTFDSNLSFLQSLTEAVKLVPTAVLLASLPDSAPASSGFRGRQAIQAIEHLFGRVQALWRPVATEEAFEIVRRRLFEPIRDGAARDATCRAFADAYTEGTAFPGETQEARYHERLCQGYPIHPEVFDRLYDDWTTIDGFQRTRGVLKLMAKVIARLWKDNNQEPLIQPGSLPLFDADVRSELTYLLPPGWDPVVEGDIDGDRAETTDLEAREPRFGQLNAARRVARTLFLGTAPSSVSAKPGIRGLDRARVLLGCVQPGQAPAVYADALGRLSDRLHYLNSAGDKGADATRYWFDTRANLRREMEDRKRRFNDATEVRKRIEDTARRLFAAAPLFDGVHVFTPHADLPDDAALRLVVLPPEQTYLKDAPRAADDAVLDYLRSHGAQPRHRANRLLFVAADQGIMARLRDATRVALAWESIVDDVDQGRLNIDQNQRRQAAKEKEAAVAVLPRAARECFRWLLCPVQDDPKAARATVEAFSLNTTSGNPGGELERVCRENELVIETWSPIHLRSRLKELYWKDTRHSVTVSTFWEDSLRYLYLPRLKTREVLNAAVRSGATSLDFFGLAEGESSGKYEGFRLGKGDLQPTDTTLLIEPEAARSYEASLPKPVVADPVAPIPDGRGPGPAPIVVPPPPVTSTAPQSFRGLVDVPAATAKMKLALIADELLELLASDPNATVRVTLDIDARFPLGVSDATKRSVSENASSLGFQTREWDGL